MIGGPKYDVHWNGLIDEVALFNEALSEDDIKSIMNKGLERVLGITAVSPKEKLATAWGIIKAQK